PGVPAAVVVVPFDCCLFALFAAAAVASASLSVSLLGLLISGFSLVMLQFFVGCWGLMGVLVCTATSVSVAAVEGPLIAVCLHFFVAAAVVGGFECFWRFLMLQEFWELSLRFSAFWFLQEMSLLRASFGCTPCGRCNWN
ncbi:hypothetical protein Ancab_019203, partial [Ancistrocladus abbreviatus]